MKFFNTGEMADNLHDFVKNQIVLQRKKGRRKILLSSGDGTGSGVGVGGWGDSLIAKYCCHQS